MPLSRRAPKVDIRNLHIDTTAGPQPASSEKSPLSAQQPISNPTVWHNPAAELKTIAYCGLPLIILIIIASYFDHHKGWVIPLAEWLMNR